MIIIIYILATVNALGNIYFPVVNRIMIQIYNKNTQSYEIYGTNDLGPASIIIPKTLLLFLVNLMV